MALTLSIARRMLGLPLRATCNWSRVTPAFNVTCKRVSFPAGWHNFSQTTHARSETGVYKSRLPDVEILSNMNYVEYIMKDFDTYGDREAVVDGVTGKTYTFSQLKELVYKCASGFRIHGFQPGFMCAIHLPNVPEFTIAMHAVLAAGGVLTPTNPVLTADEMTRQLSSTKPDVIITLPGLVETVAKVKAKVKSIRRVYVVGESHLEGCEQFSSLLDNSGSAVTKPADVGSGGGQALIPYSSGTTGFPKGVVISHTTVITLLQQLRIPGILHLTPGDCSVAILPFFHYFGIAIMGLSLAQGARLVTLPTFAPELYLRTLQDYKVTMSMIVPPIALFLANHPAVDDYDLSSLRVFFCGGAPISDELPEAVLKRTNPKALFRKGYGMTELVSHASYGFDASQWTKGSTGSLLPNTEAKIIDPDTGVTLPRGKTGEICTRSPQRLTCYYDNEEATRALIDEEGWVHTGDIGYVDDKEQLHAVDRRKDLIKYKAFQVAPAELEALLLSHPKIEDAAVIGVPDERAGEVPKAFVVRGDKNLLEDEVFKFVEAMAAPFKKLRGGVEFVDEIPKSQSGKILRRFLREREPQKKV